MSQLAQVNSMCVPCSPKAEKKNAQERVSELNQLLELLRKHAAYGNSAGFQTIGEVYCQLKQAEERLEYLSQPKKK